MAPSEAERLNIESARFYLSEAKTVKTYCRRVNRRCREQAGLPVRTSREVLDDMKEHLRQLREHYTGSS